MLSDIEISQQAKKIPIEKIAKKLGIDQKYLIPLGKYIAKIDLSILDKIKKRKSGKYILVTAITPTPQGEGKTVTTIGLAMALNKLGHKSISCIRQPSLGPVFGIKGGAAGGGYTQVMPMEDFNLHFTGDVHAVGLAHNLAAAYLDNSIFKGNRFNINRETISWRRVLDINDRFLRNIKIGLGLKKDSFARQSGFDITASSEIMAILALSKNLKDLHHRLDKIVLAFDTEGKPVTAKDIMVSGSMCVLLKDALKPNLIQTTENTPCFVHAGPFANIAHGNSSIIADEIALKLCDYTVTEAGFGADCGAEKFFDIKCRLSGFKPDAAVVVCSLKALKAHNQGLHSDCLAIQAGLENLEKQIENILIFGVPVVVAINKFSTDSRKEIELVKRKAKEFGAVDCCVSEVWAKGSKGGLELARAVIKIADKKNCFHTLYSLDMPIKEKISIIARKIYGAKEVHFSEVAKQKIKKFTSRNLDKLPICMAKTHLSLSHDPCLKGRPKDFVLHVRDIYAAVGAGFLYPLCGEIQTMPGLPGRPVGEKIDIDHQGKIKGLS